MKRKRSACHGEHKHKARWIPTKVKVEEHVVVPNIDQNIENLDQFLEDYTTNMAISPMDKSKALWEFHLVKLKYHMLDLDNETPLKGKPSATVSKFIHRIISFDDVKVVKNAMNISLQSMKSAVLEMGSHKLEDQLFFLS
ncbi:hypothetical protein YC2023_085057 [Brassica napus]